jgi:hypothetical protein
VPYSFLWLNSIPLYWCTTFCLSIPRWQDYFYLSAISNDTTMKIHVQVFVWAYVFSSLGHISRSRIIRAYGNSVFNFLLVCILVAQRCFIEKNVLRQGLVM